MPHEARRSNSRAAAASGTGVFSGLLERGQHHRERLGRFPGIVQSLQDLANTDEHGNGLRRAHRLSSSRASALFAPHSSWPTSGKIASSEP
jgi:hypothetical protein